MVLVGVRHKLNLALHSPLSSSITRLSEQTQIKKTDISTFYGHG